jgi:IS5 family transposase
MSRLLATAVAGVREDVSAIGRFRDGLTGHSLRRLLQFDFRSSLPPRGRRDGVDRLHTASDGTASWDGPANVPFNDPGAYALASHVTGLISISARLGLGRLWVKPSAAVDPEG